MESESQHRKRTAPGRRRVKQSLAIKAQDTGSVVACRKCGNDGVVIPPEALEALRLQYAEGHPCATPTCGGKMERLTAAVIEGMG